MKVKNIILDDDTSIEEDVPIAKRQSFNKKSLKKQKSAENSNIFFMYIFFSFIN